MKTEMGVVVIFIITPSDNWLDCIFLQLLPPTPGAPEKQLQTVLEILRGYKSGNLDSTPAPAGLLGASDKILFITLSWSASRLTCSVLVSGAL